MIRYWKIGRKESPWKPFPAFKTPPKNARYTTILALSDVYTETSDITYSGPFYMDFDGDLEEVLREVRTALRVFELNYEIPLDQIYCWFTGGRGFHIIIHQKLFSEAPQALLPKIYKRMAFELFDFKTLDLVVYSAKRGRMWRIPNRKRPNGKHKIPVTPQEIFEQMPAWFLKKSEHPRTNMKQPIPEDMTVSTQLQELFTKCKAKVKEEQQEPGTDAVELEELKSLDGHAPCMTTISKAQNIGLPAHFNFYGMVIAEYLAGKPGINYFNDFINLNFHDSQTYPTPGKRKEHIINLQRYFSTTEDYKFSCDHVRKLRGIKIDCSECLLASVVTKSEYTLTQIKDLFQSYMLLTDKSLEMVDVALAAVIAINLPDDPVWLLLVAPPSSAKSELIGTLTGIKNTYSISEYTPKTMASGKSDAALLNKLPAKTVLLFKDFTTVLEMRSDDKAAIFAQLRELYDGKYRKAFGNGVVVTWKGKLGIIAGVTEIIDTQYKIAKILGERFIQYRLDEPDPEAVAAMALFISGTEKDVREKLKKAVKSYLRSIDVKRKIELSARFQDEIISLAIFTVKTRTGTVRDWRRQVELIPHSEGPARIAKQLKAMAHCLALVQKKDAVDPQIMRIIRQIAFDSITSLKKSIVITLCNHTEALTTSQLAEAVGYPPSTVKEAAQDLVGQEILFCDLTSNEEDSSKAYEWKVGKWGKYFKKQLFAPLELPLKPLRP